MDGLKHGIALVVTDGMTDDQIDEWIRSKLVTGIRRIKIYNSKTFYKFGKIGNFNIWFFGAVLTEMTGIAIDHWTNKAYTIRIDYPDGEIYVDRLVNIKSAMIDISRYTWTSGSEMITRIGDTAHINLGLINVTCNKDDSILTIPEGFRPQRWTTVYMYMKNESEEFMIRTASISNGSLLADVHLVNAYILINASWTV